MAGRFAGLSDLEWRLFEDVFPPAPQKRGRGMPHAPFRTILNTLLYVLTLLLDSGVLCSRVVHKGTGSVSCNSAFILHLCRFLNQEDLMEREAMVQNP
jgi:hypothetical protein